MNTKKWTKQYHNKILIIIMSKFFSRHFFAEYYFSLYIFGGKKMPVYSYSCKMSKVFCAVIWRSNTSLL